MDKFNYEVIGSGEKTILFLHGWGGNKDSFDNLISSLKYNYRIIKVDLFGFGGSGFPNHLEDIYEYALELYLKLNEINLNDFSIVAHSFGGRLALILASFFDIKINSLILIGCAGIKPRKNLKTSLKICTYKLTKQLYNLKLIRTDLSKFGSEDFKNLSYEKRRFFIRVVNEDLKWLLKNIGQKTLIINGKNDTSTPVYMAKILHKNIENSTLLILHSTGHFCFFDYPFLIVECIFNNV